MTVDPPKPKVPGAVVFCPDGGGERARLFAHVPPGPGYYNTETHKSTTSYTFNKVHKFSEDSLFVNVTSKNKNSLKSSMGP